MSHAAETSSPYLVGITQTGRYLIVLPRHLHLLRRSQSLLRLAFLVLVAGLLLWLPLALSSPS
jgi:hypothetical protein